MNNNDILELKHLLYLIDDFEDSINFNNLLVTEEDSNIADDLEIIKRKHYYYCKNLRETISKEIFKLESELD